MALTKPARSKILALVQDAKRLLMKEVEEQLQQYYGVRPDGTILMIEQLTTSDSDFIYTARVLRQRLDYIKTNLPDKKNEDVEAVRQLVREQAFTILNRFASLRMAEERGIIKETVRKAYNSEGFQVFDSITGQGQTASQYIRYKWYIHAIFDELALDLPSVFDRYSPYALIFPSEQAMNRLLDIINREEITLHREEGIQPVNLWKEDETIGWIYQYYNSREEISAMRDASSAPRNSQELAVRNQFFTPRYVVQFLTDNSLGRIWYEMTEGNTVLKSVCPYIIVRPGEVFLRKGESKPESSDENTVYIEYRAIKDPREIFMLDPACGSMHFGLYCFDLFEHIYTEAWDNYPELLTDLRNNMTRSEFVKQIPEFIIRHNIHGVDIDPRALQIAGLSLWLRAQKSFDKQNLSANQRPQITRSNLVLAEPMPGSIETLSQLVQPLDAPMRKLVLAIWDKMKIAGETGLLLRIEDEIDKTINEISKELADGKMTTQLSIGGDDHELMAAERAAIYATKQYREHFLNSAEVEVLKMLKQFAESATDGDAYQKLLFADDTARGFAFIELSRKKYDVVVMNPPFGTASVDSKEYIDINYPKGKNDLASVFVERMHEMLNGSGFIGAITTRTIFFLGSYQAWRQQFIIDNTHLKYFADLGGGVLDAMVETGAYIIGKRQYLRTYFIRATKPKDKGNAIREAVSNNANVFIQNTSRFKVISNKPLCYWLDQRTLDIITQSEKFQSGSRNTITGAQTSDNFRFVRCFHEVLNIQFSNWPIYLLTDDSLRFFYHGNTCLNWKMNGAEVIGKAAQLYGSYTRTIKNENLYFQNGLSWARRTARFEPHMVPINSVPTSGRYETIGLTNNEYIWLVSLWNSSYYDYILKLSMENDFSPQFIIGVVNQSPYPLLSKELQEKLTKETLLNHGLIEQVFQVEETSLYFKRPVLIPESSILFSVESFQKQLSNSKSDHLASLNRINELVYNFFGITKEEQEQIHEIVQNDEARQEGAVFDKENKELIEGLFSWLVGCVFGRWDVRFANHSEWLPVKADIFSPLPGCSPGSLISTEFLPATQENIVSDSFLQKRQTLENKEVKVTKTSITYKDYPIQVLWNGIGVVDLNSANDLVFHIRTVIREIWGVKAGEIEDELAGLLGVKHLEDWLLNPNKFFNSHLNQYTQNKRIAPIYWPLSTTSGSYTIWVYYPKLNDQTLFKVVNDFILPKQQEVAEQIKQLENNPNLDNKGKKELSDSHNLFHELKDMEKDLLEVASLPYKPNHDDGVLITASPLYKFFRHSKWKKSTEESWKALQKGEYDWAHLAYSIWPERVTKKCRKDLSMAIAHGLEETCEVKPKEKKEKKVAKSANKTIQAKLID